MLRSLPLDPQPTARQTREILFHVGHEMVAMGAEVDHTLIGGFRFRMPPVWRLRHFTYLLAVTSGRITIGADSGEPWRVRYELRYTGLFVLILLVSGVIVAAGLQWRHGRLLDALIALWGVAYALPFFVVDRQFRLWLADACASAPVTRGERHGSL
jgi:hypothetical protein